MKILNVYYGTDAYCFETEPFHAHCRYSVDEEYISTYIDKARDALQRGKCFWYLVSVVDFNPITGIAETRNYYDGVKEKAKTILNARAKQGLSTPVLPKAPIWGHLQKNAEPVAWPAEQVTL